MITVVGYDGNELSREARDRVAGAELVVGGARHLATLPEGTPTRTWSSISEDLQALLALDGDGVVLASGDPGLFGPVRRLRELTDEVEVLLALSSVQVAFARAGLPWDDAVVVSAHGRSARPALNVCRAHPKVAVLTGPGSGPDVLGAGLVGWERGLFVAERLGTPEERCRWVSPEDAAAQSWEEPNVVLVVDRTRSVRSGMGWLAGREQPGEWALPEEAFSHRDAMVTKAEVRALVLARLGPRLGDLVWDVGAGSGSVAVECARLGAAVVAVEQGPLDHLSTNVARFGVDVLVVQGAAPAALDDLPDPDAVFVGGGGEQVVEIVHAALERKPRVVVVALAALDRVAEVQRALSPYQVDGVQLQASRLRALGEATGLAASNPVFVLWGTPR
ncbi:MAG TPA: precorrin-6y C5,15-methyltransferase (decarboxylating) subunit CbiE [Mycobacteriales bacterium]|nr:precorrin-6y C5,15-methyltransferase (decarboxylating) subunit CbiE [Mycobacteriales bacterium]